MSETQRHSDDEPAEPPEELYAQLEAVREENDRLRREYARAKQTAYRRTALGLAGTGVASLAAAAVLPGVRDILLVLGATGVFGGILTRYLTPERVVTVDVGESVYDALSEAGARLVDELGLRDDRVYLPVGERVRLFVPKHADFDLPDGDTLFVTDDDATRGVTLPPSGRGLVEELDAAAPAVGGDSLVGVARQAGDALVEQFEVADSVDVTAAGGENEDRVVVRVSGESFGSLDQFDHPVVSVVGVALADELDAPISVDVTEREGELVVACTRIED
jgi:hypothetical protein